MLFEYLAAAITPFTAIVGGYAYYIRAIARKEYVFAAAAESEFKAEAPKV